MKYSQVKTFVHDVINYFICSRRNLLLIVKCFHFCLLRYTNQAQFRAFSVSDCWMLPFKFFKENMPIYPQVICLICFLTRFSLMLPFYTPCKHQKTKVFLVFFRGKMKRLYKNGLKK